MYMIIDMYIQIDIECDKTTYHKKIYIRSKVVQTMPSTSVNHPAVLRIEVAHELTLGVAALNPCRSSAGCQ